MPPEEMDLKEVAKAFSQAAVSAKAAADAMTKLAAAAVDWPMAIAAIATLIDPAPKVFPPLGVKLT